MKQFLTDTSIFASFSRPKIIIIFIALFAIVVVLVVSQNYTDDGSNSSSFDNKTHGQYIKSNHGEDVENLLQKLLTINHESLVEQDNHQSPLMISNNAIESVQQENSLTKMSAGDVPSTEILEHSKFKDAQTANMYLSVKAKSLMYGIKPVSIANADNKLANNQRDVVEDTDHYTLKAGGIIPAIMLNGLNSELPGSVVAIVRANIYDSITRRYLLIPQGSKLIGSYDASVIYGQERIAVAWNRLIYPNGDSTALKAVPGTDIEGYSGFYDQVDNHYFRLFGASFIMGIITGAMQYSQNNTNNNAPLGANPTVGQTMAGSLGQQMGQTGMMVTQKNLNVAPTIVIRPNYPFSLLITSDLRLKPIMRVNN